MDATLSYSTLSFPWTSAWLGIAFSSGVLHQRPFTPQTPYTRWPYTTALLHRKPFTPETFYTRGVLRQKSFTPKTFYTTTLLRRKIFIYTREPLAPGSLICVLQSRLVLQVRLPSGIDISPLLLSSTVGLVVRYSMSLKDHHRWHTFFERTLLLRFQEKQKDQNG